MAGKTLRHKALAAALAVVGLGVMIYGVAVVFMADTPALGALSAGACCLPLALILFITAYAVYKEAE